MSTSQLNYTQGRIINIAFGYAPAVLKEYRSGWRIEYYVTNPITGELVRRQEKVQHYVNRLGKQQARAYLRNAVFQLNLKLSQGWSPFFVQEDTRLYEKLSCVAEKFLKEKTKDLRAGTMRSYKSGVEWLVGWSAKMHPTITAGTFSHNIAVRYMDYIADEGVANTTYNNRLKVMRAFFNWCVEKCYAKENPFDKIKTKRKELKKRILVPADVRAEITAQLEKEKNVGTQLLINLVYQSLLRPKEVAEIKVKDVFLEEKYIRVPAEVAKNRKERKATLSDSSIEMLKVLKVAEMPADFFVLGGNNTGRQHTDKLQQLTPHKEKAANTRYRKEWDSLRKKVKFPQEMQLYSLRDTGITDMLKSGIDDLTVMQHADHHSLEMTSRYAKHIDTGLVQKMNKLLPDF